MEVPADKFDVQKCPKAGGCSVVQTIIGDDFSDFIDDVVQKRNHRLTVEAGNVIQMDPDVYKSF